MDSILERLRFREIERRLYNQLHEAQETLRLATMNNLSQEERERAAESLRLAFERWQALVIRREVPEDLKDGNG